MKISKNFRLEEDTIKKIDELVEYHQKEMAKNFPSIKVNRTTVIETLVGAAYNAMMHQKKKMND
ncbi:hypothetical protein IEO70_03915 [Bacillus sp. AGMB 02131]|uniref:Uncharacterized protein n=1 Tax=Peribacillus faecalis TaxID=2772559 RepID=A0A927CVG7_9BACI|nr:hypothetical protein [Peribacillus faecalis]MBD3107502.1 hypothetical protein [Peribacillus faecalis]